MNPFEINFKDIICAWLTSLLVWFKQAEVDLYGVMNLHTAWKAWNNTKLLKR